MREKISRKKKILINTIASILSELVSVICSLILPRLLLSKFGSEYNGIINSITQCVSFVTLLRAGVGGVTRAALYRPLADNDTEQVSAILNATEKYMRKIAVVFLFALGGIAALYPLFVSEFSWGFTFSLFLIIGSTTFVQYYFGITYQMLLLADQKNYVYVFIHIVSIILNTLLSVILINCGAGIHFVKLASATAFSISPIFLHFYVKHKYSINKKIKPDMTSVNQRWHALGHQISHYVSTSTDMTVLTVFSNVTYVSIYSVYYLVIKAIKMVIKTIASSVEAALGNIIASEHDTVLNRASSMYECFMCLICSVIFSCTITMIVPFAQLYTQGIADVNYSRPLFSLFLVLSELMYCLRLPYMSLVEASGHYKQTKNGSFWEAGIKLGTSVLLCITIDPLVGVALSAFLATTIRTFEIGNYANRIILHRSNKFLYKAVLVCGVVIVFTSMVMRVLKFDSICTNLSDWLLRAIITLIISVMITTIMLMLSYRKTFYDTLRVLLQMVKKG